MFFLHLIRTVPSLWWKMWQEARSRRIARAAIRRVGLPWKENSPGNWSAFADSERGFPVKLDLCVDGNLIFCLTGANIDVPDEWFQRRVAITLLKENNRYLYGSNRSPTGPNGLSVVHGHHCLASNVRAEYVADICRLLVKQMQELLEELYAEKLIELPIVRAEKPKRRPQR